MKERRGTSAASYFDKLCISKINYAWQKHPRKLKIYCSVPYFQNLLSFISIIPIVIYGIKCSTTWLNLLFFPLWNLLIIYSLISRGMWKNILLINASALSFKYLSVRTRSTPKVDVSPVMANLSSVRENQQRNIVW